MRIDAGHANIVTAESQLSPVWTQSDDFRSSNARQPPGSLHVVANPADAVRLFLRDLAEVAGYTRLGRNRSRAPSIYVLRRPVLTAPDPWFFAGLVALESAAICSLFPPANASELLRHIADQADATIADEGRGVAKVVFALMGRLGYGAVLMRMPIPMTDIANVLLLMMGGLKSWTHLLPDGKALRQIRVALKTGAPSWWREFARTQPIA